MSPARPRSRDEATLSPEDQALSGRRPHFHDDLSLAPDVMFLIERSTLRFVDVNRIGSGIFGWTRKDLLARGPLDVMPRETPGTLAALFERTQTSDPEPVSHETTFRRGDGTDFPADVRLTLCEEDIIAAVRDVSERHRILEELRDANAFLDSIVENIPDMIFVKRAGDHMFVRFNRAGEELIGVKRSDLIGKTDHDFYPKEQADFFHAKDRETLENRKLVDIPEEPIQTKDKGERILHTKKIPVLDQLGNPRFLLGISEDITERKRAQERFERQAQELARSNAELQQFAYVASHDLQEPLRKIASYTQLLERRYKGKLDQDADEFIHYVVDGANRMQNLIRDLLAYARVGSQGGAFVEADAGELVDQARANLEVAIRESGATVAHSALPRVKVERTQFVQLIQNLLSNAIKFRGEQAPIVRVSAVERPGEWVFSVKDNGIGLDMQWAEKIFVIFQRLHARGDYPGTGIGLAICKKIVERHGGTIWVESAPGQGATFFFSIPSARAR
jgi:PAS domain S-box-containing protein